MCLNWPDCESQSYLHLLPHSSLISEVRQPPPFHSPFLCFPLPLFLALSLSPPVTHSVAPSLSLISLLSVTFLPLINARGMCGRSRCVWICVCECATKIMDVLSCVLCVGVVMACVCVCAYLICRALISHASLSLN